MRQIDADALIKALHSEFDSTSFEGEGYVITDMFEEVIDKQPSVTISGLIHCSECEYGKVNADGDYYCSDIGCSMGNCDGSGFCSDAKRREGTEAKSINEQSVIHTWISVNEKLPENEEDVLVWYEYYRYGEYNCMWQTYGIGYRYMDAMYVKNGGHKSKVIAWMPLPKYEP